MQWRADQGANGSLWSTDPQPSGRVYRISVVDLDSITLTAEENGTPMRRVVLPASDVEMAAAQANTWEHEAGIVETAAQGHAEMFAELKRLRVIVERLSELHKRLPLYPYATERCEDEGHNLIAADDGEWVCDCEGPLDHYCAHCSDDRDEYVSWPCETMRIIDGGES